MLLEIHETRLEIAEIPDTQPKSLEFGPKNIGIPKILQIPEIPEIRCTSSERVTGLSYYYFINNVVQGVLGRCNDFRRPIES